MCVNAVSHVHESGQKLAFLVTMTRMHFSV